MEKVGATGTDNNAKYNVGGHMDEMEVDVMMIGGGSRTPKPLAKGTIKNYFFKMHPQGNGQKPGREENVGGGKNGTGGVPKSSKLTNLSTRMKKKPNPRVKKLGALIKRGAKSKIRGWQLTRGFPSDSS